MAHLAQGVVKPGDNAWPRIDQSAIKIEQYAPDHRAQVHQVALRWRFAPAVLMRPRCGTNPVWAHGEIAIHGEIYLDWADPATAKKV
jgi:hypothetical protein